MSAQITPPEAAAGSENFWQGMRVRLRGIEPEDAEIFHRWNADSEMARQVDFVWPPTSLVATRAWTQRMATQEFKDDILCCAIETLAGQLVGSINSHSTNRRAGTFGYGVAIGAEHRGRGYAAEAVTLLLRYFFEELRYQKATVIVYADNVASIALHEKLGFVLEGRVRRVVYTRGAYHDQLFYGITCEELPRSLGSRCAGNASILLASAVHRQRAARACPVREQRRSQAQPVTPLAFRRAVQRLVAC